jgi:hypothetical protein
METIVYYLFDNIRVGIIVALLAEAAVMLWWAFTRSNRSRWALLIGPAVIGLLVLLDWAVETNREQAERITRQIVQAAEDEDARRIISLMSPDMTQESGWYYAQVCERIEAMCSKPLIERNYIRELVVESADNSTATVRFVVTTIIDPKCPYKVYAPAVNSEWRFEFTRMGNSEYRLNRFAMLSFNGEKPIDILTDVH